MSLLDTALAQGFDRSTHRPSRGVFIGCSACEALVIQGVPCHERGCPNAVRECKGCGGLIPARQVYGYCPECS